MIGGPSLILAGLVGLFHSGVFVLIRGSGGSQIWLILLAAVLGAWAGDAIGARLGIDFLRVGDFRLLSASIVAWIGIGLTAVAAILGPARNKA